MDALHFEVGVPMKIKAEKLFDAGVMRIQHISHLIASTFMKEGSIVDGCKEGGVGCVKLISMTDAYHSEIIKARVDFLDKKKLEVEYNILDGPEIGKKLEKTKYRFKIVPSIAEGESILILSADFHPLPGADFTEKDLNKDRELLVAVWKDIEAYLLEHPDA